MTKQTYFIALISLCCFVFIPLQVAYSQLPEQDCIQAIPICTSITTQTNSYTGEGLIPNEINSNISCLSSGEENSVWYSLSITDSGLLYFTLTPLQILDDYDFAVFDLTQASCADIFSNPFLEVSCNYSAIAGETGANLPGAASNNGGGGPNRNAPIPVLPGQTYLINISNFSGTASGFTLDFTASTINSNNFGNAELSSISRIGNTDTLLLSFSQFVQCGSVSSTDFTVLIDSISQPIDSLWSSTCIDSAQSTNQFKFLLANPILTSEEITLSLVDTVKNICGNPLTLGSVQDRVFPAFQATASSQSICLGDSIALSTSLTGNGYTYLWLPDSLSGPSIRVSPNQDEIYRVIITDTLNNQTRSDTVSIRVKPTPLVDMGPDLVFCEDSLLLSVPISTWAAYQWEDGSSDSIRSIQESGIYSLQVTGQNGCMSSDSILITRDTVPRSEFSWMTDTLSVNFTNTSVRSDSMFNWDFGDGSSSMDVNPSHTYDTTGSYTVILISSNACGQDTLVQEIDVNGWATSISPEVVEQFLKIHPNPGSSYIEVNFLHRIFMGETIQLYDIQGRLLRDYGIIDQSSLRISRDKFVSGIYFLRIGNVTRKLWFK